MQCSATSDRYNARVSKDERYEYTIMFDASSGIWDVDCWIVTGEHAGDNHWHKSYRDETKAMAEYNRFE